MRSAEPPRLTVVPVGVDRGAEGWRVTCRLENRDARSVRVIGSRLPHGRFRGPERAHDLALEPGAEARLELEVRCAEPAGSVIENAFLILRVAVDGEPWRLLARLTVRVDAEGAPIPTVEVLTSQRAGFSGVNEEGESDAAERA